MLVFTIVTIIFVSCFWNILAPMIFTITLAAYVFPGGLFCDSNRLGSQGWVAD